MEMNKEKFLKSSFGSSLKECITAWNKSLYEIGVFPEGTIEYIRSCEVASWCQAQWEVYQMAVEQFYGVIYDFSRTDKYFGICTADKTDWLFKINQIGS